MDQKCLSRSVHLLCVSAYHFIEWRHYYLCNYLLTEEHLNCFIFSALSENLYTYMYSVQSIISVSDSKSPSPKDYTYFDYNCFASQLCILLIFLIILAYFKNCFNLYFLFINGPEYYLYHALDIHISSNCQIKLSSYLFY